MNLQCWILSTLVFCSAFAADTPFTLDSQAIAESFNPFWTSGSSPLIAPENHTSRVQSSKDCSKPSPARISLRHIEPKGIGYNQGYTTISGFFTPFWSGDIKNFAPFMDLRIHVFDDSRFASNAGIGLRYLSSNCVWGVNTYYDFRQTSRHNYNQIAAGLEALTKIWDFRINGYLPVGGKSSSLYDTEFQKFQGHYLYLRSKKQFAMKGANGEVGVHIGKKAPLYFAGGPYYLSGEGKSALGGQLRGSIDLFKNSIRSIGTESLNQGFIRLEGNVSYDHIFKWIGQGQISLNVALGGKQHSNHGTTCSRSQRLLTRAFQGVDRMEIIPVSQKQVSTRALDPNSNPYFFWFVDNTSHSAGTFEDPFPTLIEAQNASSPDNIIYVFPGDGTTTNMNTGIALQDRQRLWGSGVGHNLPTSLGNITIPALTTTHPTITNTNSGGSGVTLARDNEVSGFVIDSPANHGIFGADVGSPTLLATTITGSTSSGILLVVNSDNSDLLLKSLSVSNTGFGDGIRLVMLGDAQANLQIANSELKANNGSGIDIEMQGSSLVTHIAENSITNNANYGVFITGHIGTLTQSVTRNNISNNLNGIGLQFFTIETLNQQIIENNITNNNFDGCGIYNGSIETLNQRTSRNIIQNNQFDGFNLITESIKNVNEEISENIISNNGNNGIYFGPIITTKMNLIISNNIISENAGGATNDGGIALPIFHFSDYTAKILNNEITANHKGINASTQSSSSNNAVVILEGNIFSGNTLSPAFQSSTVTGSSLCFDLENNMSDTGYLLDNTNGIIYLAPTNVNAINTGTISSTNPITPQAMCP